MDNKQLSTNNANELVPEYKIPDLMNLSADTVRRLLDTGVFEVFTLDEERLVSVSALAEARRNSLKNYIAPSRFPRVITVSSYINLSELPVKDEDYTDFAIDAGLDWDDSAKNALYLLLNEYEDQSYRRLLIIAPAGLYVDRLAIVLQGDWDRVDITWRMDPRLPDILRDFDNEIDNPLKQALIIADDLRLGKETVLNCHVLVLLRPTLSHERLLEAVSPIMMERPPYCLPEVIIELVGIGEQVRFEDIVDDLNLGK